MLKVSRGHRQLKTEDLSVKTWTVGYSNGQIAESPVVMEDWAQGIGLEVETVLEFKSSGALERLGLPESASLGVQTLWHSPGTKLRGASPVVPLSGDEVIVAANIPGHLIRTNLRIEHVAVLTSVEVSGDEFAPWRVGSIVWASDPESIRLEGVAPRLPILPTKFSNNIGLEDGSAMWWLRLLSRDLNSDAAAALWLWVNTENAKVKGMLEEPEGESGRVLADLMGSDISRQLIMIAIRDDDFDTLASYPHGSLGFVLQSLVNLLGADISELRIQLRDSPESLDVRIQACTARVLA